MEGKSWRYYLGIVMIVLLFVPLVAWAADMEMKVGPAKIKAGLGVSTEYNNNINLKANDKKGSLIYRITPGLTMQMPLGEKLFLQTGADLTYKDVVKGDTTWTGHANGLARYSLSNHTSLGIGHDYTKGQLYGVNSGENYQLNQSQAQIKHQFGPLTAVSLSGGRDSYITHLKTGSSEYTEYNQNSGGIGIEQKLTSTTTLTLNGNYQNKNFKDTNSKDFDSYSGMVGISERIAPRLTVGVQGGYTNRDYDQGEDAEDILYGADLNYILSALSTLNISYARSLQDTFYPDARIAGTSDPFSSDRTLTRLLDEEYRYMRTDNVGANLNYNLTDKDVITLGGGYSKSTSGQGLGSSLALKLKESTYYGGLGISHRFTSWLAFSLNGSYGKRVSNARDKYDYYTASGGLNLSF